MCKLKLQAPDCLLKFAGGLRYEFSTASQLDAFRFALGLMVDNTLL